MSLSTTIRRPDESPARSISIAPAAEAGVRMQSLDVLRGVTIVLMILVNQSGDLAHSYRLIVHSAWNGLTFADVVFPCFLFIVGVSLVLSLHSRMQRGADRAVLVRRALRRAVILFAFGIVINAFSAHDLATLRIYGVLQRIAFCYFLGVLLYLWLKPRTLVVWTMAILVGYYVLLRWVPVPGSGMPGVHVAFLDPYANLPAWLDRQIFSAGRLYVPGVYDTEGLLSSLPALASTLIGVLTGVKILKQKSASLKWIFIAATSCLAAGLLWSEWFPINKRLWTSSFVLVNAGIALGALGVLEWWLDGHQERGRALKPFTIFGMNSLAAYIFSGFLGVLISSVRVPHTGVSIKRWLFHLLPAFIPNRYLSGLLCAIVYIGVCFVPMWWLYRKRIFLKV